MSCHDSTNMPSSSESNFYINAVYTQSHPEVPQETSEPRRRQNRRLSWSCKLWLIFFLVFFVVWSVGAVAYVVIHLASNSVSPSHCKVNGLCEGHLIRRMETSSYNQCLTECDTIYNCAWITFEQPIHRCYLFTDCVSLDETCVQCMSGEVSCPRLGYTKIIVATGYDGDDICTNVEVIDTSDRQLVCDDLPPYHTAVMGATGGLLSNTPVICGGNGTNTCYSLVKDKWQLVANMSRVRFTSASAVVGDKMLVLGGYYKLNTFDVVGLNGSEPRTKGLPSGVHKHCAVALNESTIMIIGGWYRDLPRTTTYYYHSVTDHWIRGPDLNTGRYVHSCTAIKSNDSVTVVVAGGVGKASVEVFPTGGASEWSFGKPLPVKIGAGQLVPDATGNGVFMIGGFDWTDRKRLDAIYHMPCVDCEWVKMTQTLKAARELHVAIAVPDDVVTCQ